MFYLLSEAWVGAKERTHTGERENVGSAGDIKTLELVYYSSKIIIYSFDENASKCDSKVKLKQQF